MPAPPPIVKPTPVASAQVTPRPAVPVAPPKPAGPSFTQHLEELIGGKWLVLVGTLFMFIGVVAYVGTRWDTLPVFVRVVLLYLLGGGFLGLGRWLEPKKAFVIIGRSLLGCGWAVVFFTTYALHHAETSRLIDSLAVDMVLMLIVAAAMIWHSLRYDSQLVTGFAFLLGYYAISANHGANSDSAAGLLAGPILA